MSNESMSSLERMKAVIEGRSYDRLPVQPMLMTFAGKYAGIPYGEYCRNGKKMAAAQLKTARDFGLDILLACSDPARELTDMVGDDSVQWYDDQPPAIYENNVFLKDKAAIAKLKKPDPSKGRMQDRVNAIRIMRNEAGPGAVIVGWVEGALALSADLRGINSIMMDLFDDPDFVEELLDISVEVAIDFAKAQIEAGADSIGMGEAAASLIGPKYYKELLVPRQKRILSAIRDMGGLTRLHMCGHTDDLLEDMKTLPVDVYEMDFMTDIAKARKVFGPGKVICGNISTVDTLINGNEKDVYDASKKCHITCGDRHIISPGCEVSPDTPINNIHAMVKYSLETPTKCGLGGI